ncbi:hypothetical protein BGZ76_010641 [Entomortierella beljakovae]|nr:hypothetical protein BGZ76_010641 [Entomortierella beljakovae]
MHFKTTLFVLAASIVSVYAVDDATSEALKYHDSRGSMRPYVRYPSYNNYYPGNRRYNRPYHKRSADESPESANVDAETDDDGTEAKEEGDGKYFMDPYYGSRRYWPTYPYGRRYWL